MNGDRFRCCCVENTVVVGTKFFVATDEGQSAYWPHSLFLLLGIEIQTLARLFERAGRASNFGANGSFHISHASIPKVESPSDKKMATRQHDH